MSVFWHIFQQKINVVKQNIAISNRQYKEVFWESFYYPQWEIDVAVLCKFYVNVPKDKNVTCGN